MLISPSQQCTCTMYACCVRGGISFWLASSESYCDGTHEYLACGLASMIFSILALDLHVHARISEASALDSGENALVRHMHVCTQDCAAWRTGWRGRGNFHCVIMCVQTALIQKRSAAHQGIVRPETPCAHRDSKMTGTLDTGSSGRTWSFIESSRA